MAGEIKKEKHTYYRTAYMAHLPPMETEGYKVGVFGLHKIKKGWHVTHLPTGLSVGVLNRSTLSGTVAAVRRAQGETEIQWNYSVLEKMTKELRRCGAEEIAKLRTF